MTHRDKHGTSGLAHAEHRLALHEMESLVKDEGLSIHAASKAVAAKYPRESADTLRRHWQRCGGEILRTHGNQLLTDVQEDGISAVIQGCESVDPSC